METIAAVTYIQYDMCFPYLWVLTLYSYTCAYRAVNSVTQTMRFPLPDIQDCISRLSNKTIFSNIDIKEAFHSLEVHKDSQDKTSITTQWGNYKFTRASFGLKNVPAFWSKMIGKVFQPLNASNFFIHFLDDGMVFSNDFDTRLLQLRMVLGVLMDNGLILQLPKCNIIKPEVDFLGFTISKEGVRPIKRSVNVINKIPYPSTIKELRAILGKFNYYKHYMKNFANIAAPLTNLLQGHDSKIKHTEMIL